MERVVRHFEEELEGLVERLLSMGGLAEERVRRSVRAVADRDLDVLESVLSGDEPVNELGRPCRHARDGANMFLHCFAPWLALVHIA